MEDRKASVLAAAVGCAAVGGFWLARPKLTKAALKVVEQFVPPKSVAGIDSDAAVVFRVDLPPTVREAIEDAHPLVFQLADRRGQTYPLVQTSVYGNGLGSEFKLVRGYSTTPENPRIEVVSNGTVLASAPVAKIPEVTRVSFQTSPDSRIAAFYRGLDWLEVQSLAPLPKDERWHIVAKRTPFTALTNVTADLPVISPRWQTQRLQMAYPEGSEAVELEVTRLRSVEHSTTVTVPGLRIEPHFGGTSLVIDHTIDLPTSLGITLHVPKQRSGPRRLVKHGDPRVAAASMFLLPPSASLSEEARRDRARRGYELRVELLSPSPESLGLRELRLGLADRGTTTIPTRPLQKSTFSVVLRITSIEPKPFDRFTARVPITRGTPIGRASVGPIFPIPPNEVRALDVPVR